MKITEGFLSTSPAQESTGFVGLLAKHRKALDPSFNLRSEAVKLHALARAFIEALGGESTADGWQVEVQIEKQLSSTGTAPEEPNQQPDLAQVTPGPTEAPKKRNAR